MDLPKQPITSVQVIDSPVPTPTVDATMEMSGGDLETIGEVSSLADLKAKAPEVFNLMMASIGEQICHQMRNAQWRLKQLMREGRRNANS